MTGRQATLAWTLSRLVVLVALFSYAGDVIGDVNYFRNSLDALSRVGLSHTLVEYPLPAVGVVAAPWLLTHGAGPGAYDLLVVLLGLLLDGLFTMLLFRESRPSRPAPVLAWVLAGPALGPLLLTRFDLLTGILVAVSVLVAGRRPVLAGTALAVATAVKLWPVLLIAPLAGAIRPRRRALVPVVVVGGLAVVATVVLAGLDRLFSPLDYQWRRGLQIESVAGTPAMLGWWLHPEGTRVFFARSLAWEVTGPGTAALLAFTSVVTILLLAVLALLWGRGLTRTRTLGAEPLLWLVLTAAVGFVVVGKVFSPQYLLWVAPVAAAGLVVVDGTRPVLLRWTAVLLVVMLLSQLVFPVLYRHLYEHDGLVGVAVLVLAARNLLMLWLLWVALRTSWTTTRAEAREPSQEAAPDLAG